MSDYSKTEDPAVSDAPPALAQSSGSQVPFGVEQLVIGRHVSFPIEEKGGLVLLAAGSCITPRFKQLLINRNLKDVLISEIDAARMSQAPPETRRPERMVLDAALARQIDEMVDSGTLFTAEAGSQLKDRLVRHGCRGYDMQQRDELLQRHERTCSILDQMIKSAVHGEKLHGAEIATVVASYLTQLTADMDCVLDIARLARRYSQLADHCLQMSLLGMALAIELGMTEPMVRSIGLAGLLHDWGMTRIPETLLNAPRILTPGEFVEIQRHPIYTVDLLQRVVGIPRQAPLICYQVHERPNGSGYPRGRIGKSIHPCARILNVADVYIALTSPRPFRKALTASGAIECLLHHAHERIADPGVVRALVNVMSLFPIGTLVQLSDGSTARVLRRNGNHYAAPIVQLVDQTGATAGDQDASPIIDPLERGLHIARVLSSSEGLEETLTPAIISMRRDNGPC